jgi:thiazole/oxazole-forming peptide maturase SagC family component
MNGTAPLPPRPCLRPGLEVIPVDNQTLLMRTFAGTVMLSGEFVASRLPSLIPKIDGSRTIGELFALVGEHFRPEFESFIGLLLERNILLPADLADTRADLPHPSGAWNHERAYWSLDAHAPEAVGRLASSTVVLANLGGVGVSIARALATSGIGQLVLLDPQNVSPEDEIFGYGTEEVGKPRAEVLAAQLTRSKCKNVSTIISTVDATSRWDELVSDANVVVLCSDNMSLAGYDKTNEACIRLGTRWVSARIDRRRGIVGPYIVPGETACFACFELRNRANSDHPADHAAMYRNWKQTAVCPENWPVLAPFTSIVGNYLALDLLRVLAGQQLSAIFGRVLHLELDTMETRFHSILKLPRCPACSRARERPMTKLWDIRNAQSATRGSGP